MIKNAEVPEFMYCRAVTIKRIRFVNLEQRVLKELSTIALNRGLWP